MRFVFAVAQMGQLETAQALGSNSRTFVAAVNYVG